MEEEERMEGKEEGVRGGGGELKEKGWSRREKDRD